MIELVRSLATALVDFPDQIKIEEHNFDREVTIELHVRREDLGKIIGKKGRTAQALRTLVNAAGAKLGKRVFLEIVEPDCPSENLDEADAPNDTVLAN